MLFTGKELRKNFKNGMSINVDKMFSINPKNKGKILEKVGNRFTISAYVENKKISLKSAVDMLDLQVFSNVYDDFKKIEKRIKDTKKVSNDIRIAMTRKEMLDGGKYNDDISKGYINLLSNGKELENYSIFKTTLHKLDMEIKGNNEFDLIYSLVEYAENGMEKSSLVLYRINVKTLGLVLIDVEDKYREVFSNFQLVCDILKDNGGIIQAIQDLPKKLEELPTQIKENLVKFIEQQVCCKSDDIIVEYDDLFNN